MPGRTYLYFAPICTRAGVFDDASLARDDRASSHRARLPPLATVADSASGAVALAAAAGVVFELASGLPSERHLAADRAGTAQRPARVAVLAGRAGSRVRGRRTAAKPAPARAARQVAEADSCGRSIERHVRLASRADRPSLDLSRRISGAPLRHPDQAHAAHLRAQPVPLDAEADALARSGVGSICAPTTGRRSSDDRHDVASSRSWRRSATAWSA